MWNMNQQRSSFPSQTQIDALLDFLEENPRLATGVPTMASARDQSRKLWEKQSVHLNSLEGSIKSWRQWRKYWADKRNSVKKKAAQRFAELVKNGDETEEMIQLTDTEERILGMIGGDSFDTDDIRLGYNGLQTVPQSPPLDISLTSPTVDMQETNEPPETSSFENMEGQAASVLSISLIEEADVPSPSAANTSSLLNSNPQACNHTASRESSPALNTPRLLSNTNPRRTRRTMQTAAMSPPHQRRSQIVSLAERCLRVEENRLQMDRRYATIIENLLERDKERDRTVAQALVSLGDSLKLIAEALKK